MIAAVVREDPIVAFGYADDGGGCSPDSAANTAGTLRCIH